MRPEIFVKLPKFPWKEGVTVAEAVGMGAGGERPAELRILEMLA